MGVTLKRFFLVLLLLSIFLMSGCSAFKDSEDTEDFLLILLLDKKTYRPNEPVIANVRLQNLTNEKKTIYNLDAQTVNFYLVDNSVGEALNVMPVYSEKEGMYKSVDLEPLKSLNRSFVFTDITRKPGDYIIQASYNTDDLADDSPLPSIISESVNYEVSGEPPYERDVKGILMKEDAIKIAESQVGQPVLKSGARLIINEAGFYDWWINLTLENESSSEPEIKSFFINPYIPGVRAEANPFTPEKEEKKPIKFKPKSKMESPEKKPVIPIIQNQE